MSLSAGYPCLIAAPDHSYHWPLRTVCGICVGDEVYMQAVLNFGEQRTATADLGRVCCARCLEEIERENLSRDPR